MMKKFVILFLLVSSVSLFAQDDFIELLRQDLKTQKVAVITETMNFTEAESNAFWPVYREYDFEATKLADERLAIIKDYAQNFENMTDVKAKELIDRSMKNQENRLKLRKKYFKEFLKVLPGIKAARFAQVENQIGLLLDLQIAAELPLVEAPEEQ
ncbi:MAG: hypothetical protein JSW33_06155 [bacterium]|nr:MAG: hypothetical protein JSW33_06155 [bacterium]